MAEVSRFSETFKTHPWLLKRQVWSFYVAIGGSAMTLITLALIEPTWALGWGLVTIASWAMTRSWARHDPIPIPYAMRLVLSAPRPFQSAQRLKDALGICGGERLLEIGPGTGKYALPIAASLAPDGILEVLDIQHEMLDHLTRRASQAGIGNIVSIPGDARKLPYADNTFDGAYLITVLGEIPEPDAALLELRRVLKAEGCLVIGEIAIDPDFIRLSELQRRMASVGFRLTRKTGPRWAYLARFEKAGVAIASADIASKEEA